MTPTPPTTESSPNNRSPDAQFRVVRKRNRVPLSCAPCRHRKLKCNRASPCDNCVKRGDSSSCTYASPAGRKRNQSSGSDLSTPDEMQNRIDRLESLVLSLMGGGAQSADAAAAAAAAISATRSNTSENRSRSVDGEGSNGLRDEDSEVESMSRSIGVMKVHHDRQFYASEAHWWAILSDIAEVKRYFAEHQKQYEEQIRKVAATKSGEIAAGAGVLFKGVAKVDKNRILANFPNKMVADKLISRYFQTENPAIRLLHGPRFNREYENHWVNPQESHVTWLGICFSMMSMALQSYHRAGDEPPEYRGKTRETALAYSEWTAQCLVHADFTQPVTYMLECLIFYMQAEFARNRDVETSLWMLSGIIVRLAMRMGLHRDSKPYASLSPFLGEMRRRIWSVIRMGDILFSFQCGLPHMIRSDETDTELPLNIYDEEFDEGTVTMPPGRSASEHTPLSFMIHHSKMTFMLGRVQELAVSLHFPTYEATMKLDGELREAYSQIPDHLRLHSPFESERDQAKVLMERFTIDLTHQKCLCILHRKFLSRARENPRYAYSRRICIDACLEMLAHQAALHVECQPGGRLRSITWSITTSLTTHDFLLAAMIICLDLYHTAQAEVKGNTSGELYTWAVGRREAMVDAIKRTIAIWETLKDRSIEAYKASLILNVMLEKLRNHEVLRERMNTNFSFIPSANGVAADGQVAPEHSAAITLGMMRGGGLTPGTVEMMEQNYVKTGLTPQPANEMHSTTTISPSLGMSPGDNTTPFANLFGQNFGGFQGMDLPSTSLDWDGWDTYIQGPGLDGFASANIFENGFMDESGATPQTQDLSQKFPRVMAHPWVGPTPAASKGVGL